MTTTTTPTITPTPSSTPVGSMRIGDATAPLWVGFGPAGWGDTVRDVRNDRPSTAADVIAAAGLGWRVEQYPVEAIIPPAPGEEAPCRVAVPRVVANVRSDTRTVLGIVGDGYTPLQNADAFALADALIDSGEAHWLGAGSTRGGARCRSPGATTTPSSRSARHCSRSRSLRPGSTASYASSSRTPPTTTKRAGGGSTTPSRSGARSAGSTAGHPTCRTSRAPPGAPCKRSPPTKIGRASCRERV